MKDTFNAATVFLGKYHGIQNEEQHHCTFLNNVLKGNLHESVRFVCAWETGGGLQPNESEEDGMVFIDETIALFLAGKCPHEKFPPVLRHRFTNKGL